MDKIKITQYATDNYNRQSYNQVLQAVEQQINRANDGYLFPMVSVTASYAMNYNDAVILADATAGAITITLKPAAECVQKRVTIKKTDSSGNSVTIDGNGAETIDGAATKSLATQYKSYDLVSYGGAWWIVGSL